MFAYCRNNSVCRIDSAGTIDYSKIDDDHKEIVNKRDDGGGDNNAAPGGSENSTGSVSNIPAPCGGSTRIFRFGYTGPEKLVPTKQDVDSNTGLSFSTNYRPGSAMTTIDAVNSTGILHADRDGRTHVSITPIGGTLADWRAAGVNSIWTQALVSVISMS
jgi:hypothetical protein